MADDSLRVGFGRIVIPGEVGGDETLSVSLSDDMLLSDSVPTIVNWPVLLVLTRLT